MTIKTIQTILKSEGFYPNTIDGIWGPSSQAGLERLIQTGKYRVYFDFSKFKQNFNKNKIDQDFVDNINYLFEAFGKWVGLGSSNPLLISYMLATAWHETAHTMKPIKEFGSDKYLSKYDTGSLAKALGNTPEADGDGILYAGRGYVQITGKTNYKKFSDMIGVDLLKNPDYTLRPKVAADILVVGSLKGSFTGKKLSDYIKFGKYEEFKNARRVINGTDKDSIIASHAQKFLNCIILQRNTT